MLFPNFLNTVLSENNSTNSLQTHTYASFDGKKIKLTFPRNDLESIVQNPFKLGLFSNCVGFFGHQATVSQQCDQFDTILEKITDIDNRLAEHLDPTVVKAYVTCPVESGGDYMNFVLFQPNKTAGKSFEKKSVK